MKGNSGKEFARPVFKNMMFDLEKKPFDIIIVEDLSSIGTN